MEKKISDTGIPEIDWEEAAYSAELVRLTQNVTISLTDSWEDFYTRVRSSSVAHLISDEQIKKQIHTYRQSCRAGGVYHIINNFEVHYMMICLTPDCGRQFFLGPFLIARPDGAFVFAAMSRLRLSRDRLSELECYYQALPVLDLALMTTTCYTIAKHLFHTSRVAHIQDFNFVEQVPPELPEHIEESVSVRVLEHVYRLEHDFIQAVSAGDITSSYAILRNMRSKITAFRPNAVSYISVCKRLTELNMLLRKGAELGETHPVHIQRLYSRWESSMECEHSIEKLLLYPQKMVRSYCMLVKAYAVKAQSPYVRKAVNLIQMSLSRPLTVSSIAEEAGVSPDYLTRIFRQELGFSVIEYLNRQRIFASLPYLNGSTLKIQDIAFSVGFQDISYFTRLFKRYIHMSPSEYRKTIH